MGCSALSEVLTVLTVPGVPTGLGVSLTLAGVDISWNSVTGAEKYELQKDNVVLATVDSPTTTYSDNMLAAGTYNYKVRACNVSGCSRLSDSLVFTVEAGKSNISTKYGIVAIPSTCLTTSNIVGDCKVTDARSTDWQLIYNVQQLQAIDVAINLNKNYLLINDIDASATSGWNGGAGFNPIGTFRGVFDGNGHSITNLYINRSATDDVGLFSINEGTIDNLGINIHSTGGNRVGGLVGDNGGTISNSYATGSVDGNDESRRFGWRK